MAKKDVTPPKAAAPKKSKVSEQVVQLKEQLDETLVQAEMAEDLENDLAEVKKQLANAQANLKLARDEIARLKATVPFSDDDETRLKRAKAILQYEQNFKTGLFYVTLRGTAPGYRAHHRATNMKELLGKLRADMKL